MYKFRKAIILLLSVTFFITLAGCSGDIPTDPEKNEPEAIIGALQTYHPELQFNAEIYRQEVTEKINSDVTLNRAEKAEKEKELSEVILDFAVDTAVGFVTGQGTKILNKVKGVLLDKVTKYAMAKTFKILDVDHNKFLKFLFGVKEEDTTQKDTLKQIMLLAESQDVMNTQLSAMADTLGASQLSQVIYDKRIQYNAIQLVNEKAYEEMQAIYAAYADVYDNEDATEQEINEADAAVTNALRTILNDWGNKNVNGNTNYLNASILLKNYMSTWQTGIDKGKDNEKTYIEIYDAIAKRVYAWEHEGYEFRQINRTVDAAVLSQAVMLTAMYYELNGKKDAAYALYIEFGEVQSYIDSNKIDFNYDYIKCQISGIERKFSPTLWMKTNKDYIDCLGSYSWTPGWFDKVPESFDIGSSKTAKRLHFAVPHSQYNNFKEPKLLSADDYKKIVDYYGNKYTLREIFQNFAGFLNADEIFPAGYNERSYCLNSNSASDNRDDESWLEVNNDYLYWAVTDMNKTSLPKPTSEWKDSFNSARDLKFITHCIFYKRLWGGHYLHNNGYSEHNYRVFYPVVID